MVLYHIPAGRCGKGADVQEEPELKKRDRFERDLEQTVFFRFWRVAIYVLLVVVEIFVFANNWDAAYIGGVQTWYALLPALLVLAAENAVKFWGLKKLTAKMPCYVIDILCLLVITVFSDGQLISTLYIAILSEFYLSRAKLSDSAIMFFVSTGLFFVALAVSAVFKQGSFHLVLLLTNAVSDVIILSMHFLIVNFTLQIYRKNKELTQAVAEVKESNVRLQLAQEKLREVTLLKERQRIAKDIHDTAGHSMTTVIMLTEAAKLVIDDSPEEAKHKITVANLQAKNALEELRESVHLLSGSSERVSLKEQLESVIQETTDGTDIVIRSEIENVILCDAKRRFLCNTLKEGISNGLRHGGATAFWFELKVEGDRVGFTLSDNGAGMNISELKEGFGLSGMHARAESLGGSVWFETEKDGGFEIHMILPTDGGKGA